MKNTNPRLYIVVRNDLESSNPGKAMAQASHASNAMAHRALKLRPTHPARKLYEKWARETPQGFGTTIVLAGTVSAFRDATRHIETDGGVGIRQDAGILLGVIHDPTYPLRDGEFTHLIPLDTCCYFFCDVEQEAQVALNIFGLHP